MIQGEKQTLPEGGEKHKKEIKIITISFSDFSKLELPKDRWLIENLIPKEGFITIASPSGEKKTWLALSMAGSIANGTDFLGNSDFKTIKSRVLYIDEEMGDEEIQRRGNLLGLGDTENIILSRRNYLNFNDEEGEQIKELFALVERENIKAIFIDTFRSVAGGLKEDKAEDIREYFDKFRPFKNMGVAVIFLDHCRKPTHFEGLIPKKEQLLGSQDKLASIEALIMIKAEEVSGDILCYIRKSRNGKEYLPFRIGMNDEFDEQCQTTKIKLIYKGKLEERETVIDNAKRIILDLLLSSPGMKRKEIISTLKEKHMGTRNISEAIRALEKEGEISFTRVGRENFYKIGENPKNDELDYFDNTIEAELIDT
ncbi:MAG: AAA family ATPase [Candidatus Paceibacterota bacterium]